MVWGGIANEGRTNLYVINVSLTGMRYGDETLDPIVRPFAGAVGNNFILMQNNARPIQQDCALTILIVRL